MKNSKLYTKSGDKGETGLIGGSRVLKSNLRISSYGDVDELNSFVGLLVSCMKEKSLLKKEVALLLKVQSTLFNLGSNLACEEEKREKFDLPQVTQQIVFDIEKNIDALDSELPKLTNFILPGGDICASYAHVCRTVCRRVERSLVELKKESVILPDNGLELINRLSDYFFVLSRKINYDAKQDEILWSKS